MASAWPSSRPCESTWGKRVLHWIDGERYPVIMLTGEYDYLTTPEAGRSAASQIRGGECMERKGIGHFPMSETSPVFKD